AVGHDVDVSVRALDADSNVAVISAEAAEAADADRAEGDAQTYAETYVAVRRQQLSSAIEQATAQLNTEIANLDAQIAALAQPVADLDAQIIGELDAVVRNGLENQREELLSQREALQARRSSLLQQLDQLRLAVAVNPTFGVDVLSNASDASKDGGANPRRYALAGGLLGLLLGLVSAFALEHFDDSVRSKRDLETAAPGVPVLGLVPRLRRRRSAPPAVVAGPKEDRAVEAYWKLRTSFGLACGANQLRVVLVSSPNPGAGKSTTAANLAAALASAGRRVVLVDANLRRPRLHDVFGLPNDVGLTSVAVAGTWVNRAIQPVPGHDRLLVLTSGPPIPDPAAVLSTAVAGVLGGLDADVVLVDGPPLLAVTDGLVLASNVDGVIIVVRAGRTTVPEVAAAMELVEQSGKPVVGTVLNGVDRQHAQFAPYRDRRYLPRSADGAPATPHSALGAGSDHG
ncbi:MAG: polysaccharide biosynthesis tyrosine autokinase, partial [Acidimicrobiales bacterium]